MKVHSRVFAVSGLSLLCACGAASKQHHPSSPKEVKAVRIGDAVWMSENLDVDHYQNGAPIAEAADWKEFETCAENAKGCWISYVKGKHAALDNDANPLAYGTFYNYYAVHDEAGLCPKGWHVPVNAEWDALIATLSSADAKKLKSTVGWALDSNGNGNGTNESGFNALPAGDLDSDYLHWHGYKAFWWSASEPESSGVNGKVSLYSINHEADPKIDMIGWAGHEDRVGAASVRCVKDRQ